MSSAFQSGLAVVTGAAGGLGASFAKKLAARGHRLLLVDRRRSPLEQVCDSLAHEFGIQAEPCVVDLCAREEVERLAKRLQQSEDVELLVNNAGFGAVDYFADTDTTYLVGMVDVHIVAPTILTRAALPGMIDRNRGGIINVSSVSSWFHSAGNVQYGSTKNYLAVFSQSLHQELRGTNVSVQALCPGFVRTEFHDAKSMQSFKRRYSPAARMWMSADDVVECSLRRLGGRQVVVIPGLEYRILGRLAQMPLLQPLMQWFTWTPRAVPCQIEPVSPRPELVLSVPRKA